MTVDLTGGLGPDREAMFAQRPDDPEMRDSASFWVFGDQGELGLPRVGIEAVAEHWDEHMIQMNLAFPDGRLFRLRADGKAWPAEDQKGQPSVLGAGPLAFQCVEPFRTWKMTFDGTATQTTTFDVVQGNKDGPIVDLQFEVEATMAVPPWVQGALRPEARERLESTTDGDLMGGPRFEQLFRAVGSVRVGGDELNFSGSGLRIRRQGIRRLVEFPGHCWQSALFPSGKAFGYITYPPRPDREVFNEGFLFDGDGELIPARVVEAPWLTEVQALGQDVPVVFETDRGTVRIEGETILSSYDMTSPGDESWVSQATAKELPDFPPLQQAGVRYRWDGEETYGMLERSYPRTKISNA